MGERRLTSNARRLRRDPTDAETLLWSRLRSRQLGNYKFVRQLPIGHAITDFACRSARLVVELDGGQHATAVEADSERTRMIEAYGYLVIRFWNNEVLEKIDGVLERILEQLRIGSDR